MGETFPKKPRGFAALKAQGRLEELSAIASKGGKTATTMGVAHQFTHEEAVEAGRKGGLTGAGARANASHAATRATLCDLPPMDDRPLWQRALESRCAPASARREEKG